MNTSANIDDPELTPEAGAYRNAFLEWEAYHTATLGSGLTEYLADPESVSLDVLAAGLRLIPFVERGPVAFGVFLMAACRWSPVEQAVFLNEFLQGHSVAEGRILEAAAMGSLALPEHLPVTLEEFPSRIWKRALASGSASRLVTAACQSVAAMRRLLYQHEDDVDAADLMTFVIPSGELPALVDLAALSPTGLGGLKECIINRIMREARAGRLEFTPETMSSLGAWMLSGTGYSGEESGKLVAAARKSMEKYLGTGSTLGFMRTRRLGRLMFRLGFRRISSQCAKVLGHSPWARGWQFQSISRTCHSRIRGIILRKHDRADADAWMKEPALACSAMTLPLWLVDGEARVEILTSLFNRASECPWIFPRLQHVFQWHLALAGKHEEGIGIEHLLPELAVSLHAENAASGS